MFDVVGRDRIAVAARALAALAALAACTPRASTEDRREQPVTEKPPARHAVTIPARTAPPRHLAVLLHGVGDRADAFAPVARALAPAAPSADLVVLDGFHPWDGGGDGRQWFSLQGITDENRPARVAAAAAEVGPFLDAELARRGLAPERLVLVGFSQGAILASWLAIHRSPRPAALVALSGRVARDPGAPSGPPFPALIAHGERDGVVPFAELAPAARALEAAGAKVDRRVYPTAGHEITERELADVREFLAAALAGR